MGRRLRPVLGRPGRRVGADRSVRVPRAAPVPAGRPSLFCLPLLPGFPRRPDSVSPTGSRYRQIFARLRGVEHSYTGIPRYRSAAHRLPYCDGPVTWSLRCFHPRDNTLIGRRFGGAAGSNPVRVRPVTGIHHCGTSRSRPYTAAPTAVAPDAGRRPPRPEPWYVRWSRPWRLSPDSRGPWPGSGQWLPVSSPLSLPCRCALDWFKPMMSTRLPRSAYFRSIVSRVATVEASQTWASVRSITTVSGSEL